MSTSVFWCMVPIACCGPICLIVGLIFVGQLTASTYHEEVLAYNDAVMAWTSPPDPAFQLAATTGWTFHGDMNVPLDFSQKPNFPVVPSGDGVEADNTISKFLGTAPAFTPVAWPASGEVFHTINLAVNSSDGATVLTAYANVAIKTAFISQQTFQCDNSNNPRHPIYTDNCPTDCTNAHGYWHESTRKCWLYYVAEEMCFIMDKTNPRTITPEGPIGCAYTANSKLTGAASIGLVSYRLTTNTANVDYGTVTIGVRSAADPWVTAAVVTDSLFEFGFSTKSDETAAAGFLTIGFLMVACPWMLAYYLVRRWRVTKPMQAARLSDTDSETYGSSKFGAPAGRLAPTIFEEDEKL